MNGAASGTRRGSREISKRRRTNASLLSVRLQPPVPSHDPRFRFVSINRTFFPLRVTLRLCAPGTWTPSPLAAFPICLATFMPLQNERSGRRVNTRLISQPPPKKVFCRVRCSSRDLLWLYIEGRDLLNGCWAQTCTS